MKKYYHATRKENWLGILDEGIIHKGIDGIVYLAESKEDAYKFVGLRVWDEDIYVIELSNLDESKICETFDHSYDFFQCKSYGYQEDISFWDNMSNCWMYKSRIPKETKVFTEEDE